MIVKPKILGYICTTAHPLGCRERLREEIDYMRSRPAIPHGPKTVLIIGASNGYGLASRVAAAFGCRASTIGLSYDRPARGTRTATAGWYQTAAFQEFATQEGLYAKSIVADAFCDAAKAQVIDLIKRDLGQIDLMIYSIASSRRIHPKTGRVSRSVLKPVGQPYRNKTVDLQSNEIYDIAMDPASEDEIRQTVDVMGGEDWQMWVEALEGAGVLAASFRTVAYSYVGPSTTKTAYRKGTIGYAKDHLEMTAGTLNKKLQSINGQALIAVNQATVTQSSSAIPFVPLYLMLLNRVVKEKGLQENCIEQMERLLRDFLYKEGHIPLDEKGRIRLDGREMRDDVQQEINRRWKDVNSQNLSQLGDVSGYHRDFLKLFGYGFDAIDYQKSIPIDIPLKSA